MSGTGTLLQDLAPRAEDLLPLLPGGFLTVVLLIVAGKLGRRGSQVSAVVLAAFAFAVGHWATWVCLHGWSLPTQNLASTERMLYGVVLFAVGSAYSDYYRRRTGTVRIVHYVIVAGVLFSLLRPLLEREPTAANHLPAWRLLVLIGIVLAFWALLDRLAERLRGPALPLTLALVCGVAAQCFLLYGSGRLAQLTATAAISLGILTFLVKLLPGQRLPRAAAGGLTGVVTCTFADALHYMSDPPPLGTLGILVGTPFLLTLSLIPQIERMRRVRSFVMQMSLVVVVVAVAFWIAYSRQPIDDYGAGTGK